MSPPRSSTKYFYKLKSILPPLKSSICRPQKSAAPPLVNKIFMLRHPIPLVKFLQAKKYFATPEKLNLRPQKSAARGWQSPPPRLPLVTLLRYYVIQNCILFNTHIMVWVNTQAPIFWHNFSCIFCTI